MLKLREVDKNFEAMCVSIIMGGVSEPCRANWIENDGTKIQAHTISKFGVCNRYDLSKEFPLLSVKGTPFKSAIKELLWIWQKKSNNVKDLGLKIWDAWADENGSIGKAYGYQLGIKIDFPEGNMDQVDWVLYQLKNNPSSRRIVTNIFNHTDLKDMGLQPCAYSCTFLVKEGKLNCLLNQRSQDVFVASGWNVAQYAILTHMFAQVSGLEVGELVHMISDAHIYDRHIDLCKKCLDDYIGLIAQDARYTEPLRLIIDKSITNFYDFTEDSFTLEGVYNKDILKNVPVAV